MERTYAYDETSIKHSGKFADVNLTQQFVSH